MRSVAIFFICSLLAGMLYSQERTVGIMINTPDSYDGYTLFSTQGSTATYLIDNCGNLVNSWQSKYRPANSVYLKEDGTLYRAGKVESESFNGSGAGGIIERFDWEGNVIWDFVYSDSTVRQHHDFEVMPNGNILVVAWEYISAQEAIENGRNPELLDVEELWSDHIAEIQPVDDGGKVVWEWHSWDHLIQDFDSTKENYGVVGDHPGRIDINYMRRPNSDWHHCNAINYNPDLDQIILSVLSFDEIWIVDHSITTQEASGEAGDLKFRWGNPRTYRRGVLEDQKLFMQHDAHWIPDGLPDAGKILIFNNGRGRPDGLYSTVEKLSPAMDENGKYPLSEKGVFLPDDFSWTYKAEIPEDFFSRNISGSQQLPNGNILIDDGPQGTFFEIDKNENIVWKYINPVTAKGPLEQGQPTSNVEGGIPLNSVFRATKFSKYYKGFENRNLEPGSPIELNPTHFDCEIVVTGIDHLELPTSEIYPNPANNYFVVFTNHFVSVKASLYDITGNLLMRQTFKDQHTFDVSSIETGLYILIIDDYIAHKIFVKH